jgi:hypothetical protein
MALEPVLPGAAAKTEWMCPMHPEVVRSAEWLSIPASGPRLRRRITISAI